MPCNLKRGIYDFWVTKVHFEYLMVQREAPKYHLSTNILKQIEAVAIEEVGAGEEFKSFAFGLSHIIINCVRCLQTLRNRVLGEIRRFRDGGSVEKVFDLLGLC